MGAPDRSGKTAPQVCHAIRKNQKQSLPQAQTQWHQQFSNRLAAAAAVSSGPGVQRVSGLDFQAPRNRIAQHTRPNTRTPMQASTTMLGRTNPRQNLGKRPGAAATTNTTKQAEATGTKQKSSETRRHQGKHTHSDNHKTQQGLQVAKNNGHTHIQACTHTHERNRTHVRNRTHTETRKLSQNTHSSKDKHTQLARKNRRRASTSTHA